MVRLSSVIKYRELTSKLTYTSCYALYHVCLSVYVGVGVVAMEMQKMGIMEYPCPQR